MGLGRRGGGGLRRTTWLILCLWMGFWLRCGVSLMRKPLLSANRLRGTRATADVGAISVAGCRPKGRRHERRLNFFDDGFVSPVMKLGGTHMYKPLLLGLALAGIALVGASAAHADDWNKKYSVSGKPEVRVETDDGD